MLVIIYYLMVCKSLIFEVLIINCVHFIVDNSLVVWMAKPLFIRIKISRYVRNSYIYLYFCLFTLSSQYRICENTYFILRWLLVEWTTTYTTHKTHLISSDKRLVDANSFFCLFGCLFGLLTKMKFNETQWL